MLTDQQVRRLVAEKCGWTKCKDPGFECDNLWHLKGRGFALEQHLPDYTNDLNACAEMERTLTAEQAWNYSSHLKHTKGENPLVPSCWEFHVTARQRTAAFLLTHNIATREEVMEWVKPLQQ